MTGVTPREPIDDGPVPPEEPAAVDAALEMIARAEQRFLSRGSRAAFG
jgi:hypothetical protein